MRDPAQHAFRPAARRILAASLMTLLATLLAAPVPGAAASFKHLDSSQIQGVKLYELGVADANDDGLLDVFTTNHKFDSALLAGDGKGGFTDVFTQSGLSPTQEFPGYEDLHREPDRSAPGLYLYATDRDQPRDPFHIATTGIAASGSLTFFAEDLAVQASTNATVTASPVPDGGTRLDFDAQPGAPVDITVEHIDLPIAVSVDTPADPAQIRVGADVVPATTRQFTLSAARPSRDSGSPTTTATSQPTSSSRPEASAARSSTPSSPGARTTSSSSTAPARYADADRGEGPLSRASAAGAFLARRRLRWRR